MSGANQRPFIGHGVGLRVPHYGRALEGALGVDWIEVITENFFGGGGRPRAVLERVRRELPLVFHGVSLGLGSASKPNKAYLERVRELVQHFEPAWVSDHLCWTSFGGHQSHDLLPLPYTEEALVRVVEHLDIVQSFLRRPVLIENVSSYVAYASSTLSEWEFLSEAARRAGAYILLDLNNVLVSAHNNGFAPEDYVAGVAAERVWQFHLANHSDHPSHKLDDHRGAVPPEVWRLFECALERFGPVSSLVEWDEDVPAWDVLCAEQRAAAERATRVLGGAGEGRWA